MANYTVYIYPTYVDPESLPVKQGDTVSFALAGSSNPVDVNFASPSCLVNTPSPLGVNSQGMTTNPLVISESAARGIYAYDVAGQEKDVLRGDLDVTTDPPTPPED